MNKKNNSSGLVTERNLNNVLSSTGYICPRNELELEAFEKLYENFESKIKDEVIDLNEIFEKRSQHKGKVISFTFEQNENISDLKMAARKGEDSIPTEILEKMKRKHKNGDK